MQNRSIKIPASNRQIFNLAFRSRYNISFFQIFLFFSGLKLLFIILIAVLWHFGFCPELVGTRLPVLSISLTLLTQMLRRFR